MKFIFKFGDDPPVSVDTFYTLEDLRATGVNLYRAVPTGRKIMMPNGREKMVTVGMFFKQTKLGQIERGKWYRLLEEAVLKEEKTDLLNAIIEEAGKLAWLHTEQEIREHALECLSSGAYRAWKGFKH